MQKKRKKLVILKSEFMFSSDHYFLPIKLSNVFYMSLKLYEPFGIY